MYKVVEPNWWYTILWGIWMLYFCVLEYIALKDPKTGDTLSEQVWYIFSPWPLRFILAGFLCWLALHFLTRWV